MAFSWVFVGQVTVSIAVLVLQKIFRFSGVGIFLAGLKCFIYVPPSKLAGGNDVTIQPVTRKDRKLHAKQQAMIEEKGMLEGMTSQPLGAQTVSKIPYADEFDFLVMFSTVLLLTAALLTPVTMALNQEDIYTIISNLCLFCLFAMSYKLLKVELTSEVVKRSDKAYLFVFAWVAFILSWTLLSSDEHGVFRGFNMQSAIDGIDRAVTEFLNRINERLHKPPLEEAFHVNPKIVPMYISISVACVVVCLGAPAARFAKVYHKVGLTRPKCDRFLKQPLWFRLLVPLTLVVPLVPVLLQFRLVTNFWGISADCVAWLQPLCYLLTTVLHTIVISRFCQVWLNSGLVDWHTAAHNNVDHPKKAEVIVLHLGNIRALLCKVGTQLLGLAPLLMCAGILMSLNSGWFYHMLSVDSPLNSAVLDQNVTQIMEEKVAARLAAAEQVTAARLAAELADEYEDEYDDLLEPVQQVAEVVKQVVNATLAKVKGLPEGADLANFYYFIGEYLGWWTSVSWCLFSYTVLAVQRLGLTAGS